ncbi:uncharacterized protein J3D65DRAFT_103063 [Phyllosticta citribraziliensis]|uniref:Uncharacterized protein n=1 Tax=Phyllosticta citribraziliensis TaxID=989973 RepID=A0ABR1LCK4_9PEZI
MIVPPSPAHVDADPPCLPAHLDSHHVLLPSTCALYRCQSVGSTPLRGRRPPGKLPALRQVQQQESSLHLPDTIDLDRARRRRRRALGHRFPPALRICFSALVDHSSSNNPANQRRCCADWAGPPRGTLPRRPRAPRARRLVSSRFCCCTVPARRSSSSPQCRAVGTAWPYTVRCLRWRCNGSRRARCARKSRCWRCGASVPHARRDGRPVFRWLPAVPEIWSGRGGRMGCSFHGGLCRP